MSKVYKIRSKSSGLFSTGKICYVSGDVDFTKNGKVWTSLTALCQHLTTSYKDGMIKSNGKNIRFDLSSVDQHHPYRDCEILEADIDFQSVKDVNDFVDKKINNNCNASDALSNT